MDNIKFHIDDYGILPSVNKSIIDYIKKDKIDSISIICNTKFSKHHIKQLLKTTKKKILDSHVILI